MNKILPFILTTAIGFAAGTCAGIWTKCTRAIPPPPAAILGELKDAPLGSSDSSTTAASAPDADEQREAFYQQVRAEMEDFRKKCDAIKNSLRAQMEPLLTPEQRERMSRWRERPAPPPEPADAAQARRSRGFWEGFDSALVIMMVPFSLERMDESLNFTPEQKAAVHKLLLERRAKFLELVDTTPPPSFKLLRLAQPEVK